MWSLAYWPQYTEAALILLGIGRALARYGELKKPDHYDIVDVLIGPALMVWLLYMGGFWTPGP